MDMSAMNKITYGLYVLTARCGSFSNGCIINTLAQVTSSPNRVSITVNKSNYTCYMIAQSGRFNVSMIDESAPFSLFTRFGFCTGRWEDKFLGHEIARSGNGIPYIPENTCAYLSGEVVSSVDLGTHIMFIADVTDAAVLSDKAPMTYAFYHANVKPKPKPAPQEDAPAGERWICNICGYIYEGHLPEDFICPLCKHGAADFSRLDQSAAAEDKPAGAAGDTAEEKWVCNVCGYIYEGALPEDFVCPICGVGADEFSRM